MRLPRNAPPPARRPGQPAAPSAQVLLLAALCLTAALILTAQEQRVLAVLAACAAAGATIVELLLIGRWDEGANASIISRLLVQAQAGRRLAIYDRETGLFAHWYLLLRGEEECARALRYGRPLSLVVVEPRAATPSDSWDLKARIGRWIGQELRATDVAGYLGNARFAVIVPEAPLPAAEQLSARLRAAIPMSDISVSTLPADGNTYEELWQAALARLSRPAAA